MGQTGLLVGFRHGCLASASVESRKKSVLGRKTAGSRNQPEILARGSWADWNPRPRGDQHDFIFNSMAGGNGATTTGPAAKLFMGKNRPPRQGMAFVPVFPVTGKGFIGPHRRVGFGGPRCGENAIRFLVGHGAACTYRSHSTSYSGFRIRDNH